MTTIVATAACSLGSAVLAAAAIGTVAQVTSSDLSDSIAVAVGVAVPVAASVIWGFISLNSKLADLSAEFRGVAASLANNDQEHVRIWDALGRIDRRLARLDSGE